MNADKDLPWDEPLAFLNRSRLPRDIKLLSLYHGFVIRSFRCRETQKVFKGVPGRKFSNIARVAERKLYHLHAATSLAQLAAIPGHHLKGLKGERQGQYSIRINDQWRVCFRWEGGDAHDVEIVDYH